MVVALWWLTCLLLIAALIGGALAYLNRRAVRNDPILVANTRFLESLPAFSRAQRTGRALRVASIVLVGTIVLTSAILAGRVASEHVETPEFANRDIVLCLDVSGSMLPYDEQVLVAYKELVKSFHGERVGLAIFNSTTRTVFPLTNDYGLVTRELDKGIKALRYDPIADRLGTAQYSQTDIDRFWDFMGGTYSQTLPPSLIADGVASCGQLFDRAAENRSRFVVLATDNEPGGDGIYTLPEAVDTLVQKKVNVSTLYPGATSCTGNCAEELEAQTERTGGKMWASSDPSAISMLVSQVQKAQAASIGATPRVIRTDHPEWLFFLTLIPLVALVVVGWRQR